MNTTTMPQMPCFDTRTALELLWEKSKDNMTADELQWLIDGAHHHVYENSRRLETVLTGIGCFVGADEDALTGALQSRSDLSELLFQVSSQLNTITAMAQLGHDAAYLVAGGDEAALRRAKARMAGKAGG